MFFYCGTLSKNVRKKGKKNPGISQCANGLAILTRPDNPTRTRHEISGFGSTLNGFGS
jgi:hypothetical protein